jgi:hypothetical protein
MKFVPVVITQTGVTTTFTPQPFHKCNKTDWDSFYPAGESYKDTIKRSISRSNMYCLDKSVNPVLFGNDFTNSSRFDIMYVPCGYNATTLCTHT